MFEFYMAERLRHRWVRLRLYRFPGSVLTEPPRESWRLNFLRKR